MENKLARKLTPMEKLARDIADDRKAEVVKIRREIEQLEAAAQQAGAITGAQNMEMQNSISGIGLQGYVGYYTGLANSLGGQGYTFTTNAFNNQLQYVPYPATLRAVAAVMECPKPSMEMLERKPVAVQDLDLEEPRTALAIEAESLLGYGKLRTAMKVENPLRRALAKLEIEILDEDCVSKYKQEMSAHASSKGMYDPTWRQTYLKSYGKPVPEFVLAKCIEVKKELPGVEFLVEELMSDPFMLASYGGERFYLEVWDEPHFEGRV